MTSEVTVLYVNPDVRIDAGSNISLLSLILGLGRGYRAIVATPVGGEFALQLKARNIQVIDYETNNWWFPDVDHFLRHAAGLHTRVNALEEAIRKHRVSIVHVNAEYALEGALAAAVAGVPNVWNIRQGFSANLDVLRFFPLSAAAFGQIMANLSDRVVTLTRSALSTFPATIPTDKLDIIPSGLSLVAPLERVAAKEALCARLGLTRDVRVVITLGRISPEKDVATFMAVARELLLKRGRAQLHFAHFGTVHNQQYFAELERGLAGMGAAFTFAGPTQQPREMLRGADLLLFTSTACEGFARVCAESLLMETPVVATRCLGPEDYLLHDQTALLSDVGDVSHLARQVELMLDDPLRAQALAQAGNQLVRQRYGDTVVCGQWRALYADLISRKDPDDRRLDLAREVAINLIILCGQIGQRQHATQTRLGKLEQKLKPIINILEIARRFAKVLTFRKHR